MSQLVMRITQLTSSGTVSCNTASVSTQEVVACEANSASHFTFRIQPDDAERGLPQNIRTKKVVLKQTSASGLENHSSGEPERNRDNSVASGATLRSEVQLR